MDKQSSPRARICLVVLFMIGVFSDVGYAAESVKTLKKQIDQQAELLKVLQNKIGELEREKKKVPTVEELDIKKLQSEMSALREPEPVTPPSADVPKQFNPTTATFINDIGCRPKMVFAVGEKKSKEPKSGTGGIDSTAPMPTFAYVSDPAAIGQEKEAGNWFREVNYCNPLYPTTRLFLENLLVTANQSYTNLAGFPNIGANLPVTQSTTNTYQVGFGYMNKPIARQIRAVIYDQWLKNGDEKAPIAVTEQGKWAEDLFWNAFTMNAGFSYGKALNIKNNTTIQTSNSQPTFFVGASLSWNIERLYTHLVHGDARTTNDDGYYFQAPCEQFWSGAACQQEKVLAPASPLN